MITQVGRIHLGERRDAFERTGPCKGHTRTMYPINAKELPAARRVCAECPVRKECLKHALDNNEKFGVWGGASERERRAMQRVMRMGRAA